MLNVENLTYVHFSRVPGLGENENPDRKMEMGAITKQKIHSEIVTAVGSNAEVSSPLDEMPFGIDLIGFGTFAFYAFTMTSPVGGRPTGEYKIQLIAPGQKRGTRGQFDFLSGTFTILIGWSQEESIFANVGRLCSRVVLLLTELTGQRRERVVGAGQRSGYLRASRARRKGRGDYRGVPR